MKSPWLSRNLIVLSLVSLAMDAASDLLYPILPLLLTTVLGAPVFVVGMAEGIAEAIAGFTKLITVRRSDSVGRKRYVNFGYGIAAVGKRLIAAANEKPITLLARGVV